MLAPQAADEAHPAFSNLFVETEFVAMAEALEQMLGLLGPAAARRLKKKMDEGEDAISALESVVGKALPHPPSPASAKKEKAVKAPPEQGSLF